MNLREQIVENFKAAIRFGFICDEQALDEEIEETARQYADESIANIAGAVEEMALCDVGKAIEEANLSPFAAPIHGWMAVALAERANIVVQLLGKEG